MKLQTDTIRYEDFLNPPNYFRPAPFWSINDRLTPQETSRQMADMMSVGLSGGFFHSRSGLISEYLGEEWFAAMRAALQVAETQDGYLWLYDEDLWPSGAAGGAVTRANPEYRKMMLAAELFFTGETPTEREDRRIRAAYRIRRDGLNLLECSRLTEQQAQSDTQGERLVLFKAYARDSGQWGAPYANLLDPGATAEFIRQTHDVYARELGHAFGRRIPGIFTDEPNIAHGPHELPWYEGLPPRYAQETGRDLWADLPFLFFNGPAARKVRLLVQRTIARQYVEAFSKPLFEWCQEHGIAYTGHYNAEDTIESVLKNHSGNLMAHYRWQQIPGIDHLFRQTERMLLTSKQAVSVARQLGRPQVLSEIYGGMRHSATFADFRWVGNYDLAMGVNCMCPHLTWYSMAGRRKRDWPQNWNYQQTYWNELKPFNDYLTRMSVILTQGRPVVEVLMLHPMEAATASYRFGVKSSRQPLGDDVGMTTYYDKKLRGMLGAVLGAGYECDLGDEDLLAEFGSVDAARLRVGQMAYRVVVVPPGHTWRPGTFALLEKFVAAGGTLILAGDLPNELDAEPAADAWRALAAKAIMIPAAAVSLLAALDRTVRPAFRLRTAAGTRTSDTLVHHRFDGQRHMIFVTNINRSRAENYEIDLQAEIAGPLAVWDALDGSRARIELVGRTHRFTLAGGAAILLVAGPGAADHAPLMNPAPDLSNARVEPLTGTWDFARTEPNALVIDRFSYSVDGGKTWSAVLPDYQIRRELARHFGTDKVAWLQPWRAIADGHGQVRGQVMLRYSFENTLAGRTSAFFVMERMEKASGPLRVNGRALDTKGHGWLWDRHFGMVEVTDLLRPGVNQIEATLDYDVTTEIEAAYIAGDFGVRLVPSGQAGEIVPEPAKLTSGSWATQGYPFYTGRMIYRTTIQKGAGRTFLRLTEASGALFKVRLNGKDAGTIRWAPYHVELTSLLADGPNQLGIEVFGSRENLTGPLHGKEGDEGLSGPFAFEEPWFLRPEFSLFDFGLLQGAELLHTSGL